MVSLGAWSEEYDSASTAVAVKEPSTAYLAAVVMESPSEFAAVLHMGLVSGLSSYLGN